MFDIRTSFHMDRLVLQAKFEDPRSSFIHLSYDIFRKIKTSNVHHCCIDSHPSQRMMALLESSVCHIDGCLSYVHENEFIKLSMGMLASVRSWKYYEDNVLYCILLQVTFQFEKRWILMINHFNRHKKDLRPHALGGNCYRHIWALQPQTHMSIKQGLLCP